MGARGQDQLESFGGGPTFGLAEMDLAEAERVYQHHANALQGVRERQASGRDPHDDEGWLGPEGGGAGAAYQGGRDASGRALQDDEGWLGPEGGGARRVPAGTGAGPAGPASESREEPHDDGERAPRPQWVHGLSDAALTRRLQESAERMRRWDDGSPVDLSWHDSEAGRGEQTIFDLMNEAKTRLFGRGQR